MEGAKLGLPTNRSHEEGLYKRVMGVEDLR